MPEDKKIAKNNQKRKLIDYSQRTANFGDLKVKKNGIRRVDLGGGGKYFLKKEKEYISEKVCRDGPSLEQNSQNIRDSWAHRLQ